MQGKKMLVYLVLGCLLVLVLQVVLVMASMGARSPQEKYLNDWLELKDAAARTQEEPKILFVSGSNTLFGVDTAELSEQLGRPVINYGAHAALNRYLFYRAEQVLQSGDVVVLPMEYTYYEDRTYEEEYVRYIANYDPAYFRQMTLAQQATFILHFPTKDALQDVWHRIHPVTLAEGAYSVKYLNEHGDMTNNHYDKKNPETVLRSKIKPPFRGVAPTEEARTEIRAFLSWCREHGVQVYATWPCFLYGEQAFSGHDATNIERIQAFYASEGVPVLGAYTDTLYDIDDFYDSTYHLNERGKAKHAAYLTELLQQAGF